MMAETGEATMFDQAERELERVTRDERQAERERQMEATRNAIQALEAQLERAEQARPWEMDGGWLAIRDEFGTWPVGDWRLIVANLSNDDTDRWGWQIMGPDQAADEESGPDYQTWQEAAEAGWHAIQAAQS